MAYEVIQPPFTLDFRRMTRKEARDYMQWFDQQTPIRIAILEQAAQSSPGYETWRADFTPASLGPLGAWFREQVETRPRTADETEEIYAKAPAWFRQVQIDDWELTNKSFSIAMDIGMYLGQVFLKQFPTLKLELAVKPKNEANYQQPVLVGFKKDIRLNPVWVAVTVAYGFGDGSRGPGELGELYGWWAQRVA